MNQASGACCPTFGTDLVVRDYEIIIDWNFENRSSQIVLEMVE